MRTYYGHPRLDYQQPATEPAMLTTCTEDGWIITALEVAPKVGERGWWALNGETLADVLVRITNPGDGRDGDAFGWECTDTHAQDALAFLKNGRRYGSRYVTLIVQRHEDADEE